MKYRLGNKQQRALLDDKGHEVALFNKGQEELAKMTCELLNQVKNNVFLGDVIETPQEDFDRGYTAGMATCRKLMGKGSL